MRRALCCSLLLLAAGCSFLNDFRLRNVPEGSPSWRAGYVDGCQSGRHDFGTRKQLDKDAARYRADDNYREGWQAGYQECLAQAEQRDAEPIAVETPAAPAVIAAPAPATAPPSAPVPVTPPAPPETLPAAAHRPAPAAAVPLAPPAAVEAPEVVDAAAPGSAGRRAQIEARIKSLRTELQALESELDGLPQ